MNILITGGAGFVGSNTALALAGSVPDAVIVCMDNLYRRGSELNLPRLKAAGVQFHHGDVRYPDTFPEGDFDIVVECSAEPSVLAGREGSPDYLFETNLTGAYHCLEFCRRRGAAVVFLSTSRVYPVARLEAQPWREDASRFVWEEGPEPGIGPQGVTEELAMDGTRSLYGFTKLAAEQLIEEYRAAFGIRAAVNRCGVVAGPWQFGKTDQGVVALWVMAHHFRKPLKTIGYGGTGKQVRDCLHVADLTELITEQVLDIESWDGWLGNVSGGRDCSVSLRELTGLCEDVTGNAVPVDPVDEPRPSDLRIYLGDCGKLFARTSWRPRRGVGETVQDTHRWVLENEADLQTLFTT